MSVATNFNTFCDDLKISSDKRSTISSRYNSICTRLNKDFWNMDTTQGGRYVGSYGRNTANGRVSDIDMIFEMPSSLKNTYDNYIGNGQSAFLQSVKNSLSKTYPTSHLKGNRQIVEITFSDGISFEVLPAFKNRDDSFTFADSNSGGSWKNTNPIPEINTINNGDSLTNNNLKRLCKMARSWKGYCSVPIKGLLIDTLAYRFLIDYAHKNQSYLYYDFMSRDFFKYLKEQKSDQTVWYAVGSLQNIYNSENFRYKATVAYNKSLEAIQLETDNKSWSAKQKWIEIYGNRFPS
tara:strand:- start:576 stop:1454 length:879 start_codon:yes stop_codon:yes gene_type:complete